MSRSRKKSKVRGANYSHTIFGFDGELDSLYISLACGVSLGLALHNY